MSNKINGLDTRTVRIGSSASVSATGKRTPEQTAPGTPSKEAEVLITGAARHLAALESRLKDVPAVDASRVAEVRKRLDEGRYTVDPQRVADRLLRLEDEFGTSRGQTE